MKRCILGLVTAAALFLTTCMPICAEDSVVEEGYKGFGYEHLIKSEEPLIMNDFEKFTLSDSSSCGFESKHVIGYPTEGVLGGTALAISGYSSPFLDMSEPITEGVYLLSFDVQRSKPTGWFYLRENWGSKGTSFDFFGLNGTQAGHNNNWSINGAKECPANQWNHISIYLDFNRDKIYYYVNNEYATEASGLTDLYRLSFVVEGDAAQITRLDNIAMFELTADLRAELVKLGIEVPDKFKSGMNIDIGSKYVGNIFTDFDDVELEIRVTNEQSYDVEYDIQYYAKAYDGDIVWSDKQTDLMLGGKESVTHNIHPIVDKYDIYTLQATLTPHAENSTAVNADKEFSVVNVPTPGYKNYYIGANTHPGRWTNWQEVRRSLDIAGIGWLRTGGPWATYEKQKGIYTAGSTEPERKSPEFYTESCEDGIEHIMVFDWSNNIYAETPGELARDTKKLEALEKAAEAFARDYSYVKAIQLGNEKNAENISDMSPEEYAQISAAAYRGIKKGNPETLVLSNAMSRSAAAWIYRYLTALDEPVCDVLSVHLYQEAGTPESKNYDEYCMEVRNAIDRAGYKDMEMWLTEGNTSAHREYSTEQQHGLNLVRQFVYCQAYDLLDKFVFYQYQTDEMNPNDIESYFGIMRGPTGNNANAPKQAYLALTNYIAMTENAEYEDLIQYDNVWIHRYRSSDGTNTLMMYADRDCKLTNLDLGAESGVMYDVNGNPTELKSTDGKYVFSLSDQPLYFKYLGEKFERCEDVVVLDKNILEAPLGAVGEFGLTVSENAELLIESNDKLQAELTRKGMQASVKIKVEKMPEITDMPGIGNIANVDYTERRQNFGTQLYRDYVDVKVMQDGAQSALIRLPVEYKLKSANVSMKLKPYDNTNTKYWVGVVNIHNNTDQPMSGTVKITKPVEIEGQISDIRVTDIEPGASKDVMCNIPPAYSSGYHYYGGVFITDAGEEIPFLLGDVPESYGYKKASAVAIGTIEKTKNKTPVIDGVIDEDEWKAHKITDFDKSQASYGSQGILTAGVLLDGNTFGADADYGGQADFSGTVYAQWDDKYFYTAALVYDDVHYQKEDPCKAGRHDHFHILLCPTTTQRHDTRIEFSLSDFMNIDNFTDAEKHGIMYRNWSEMFNVTVGGVMPETDDGCQIEVVRKENVTIYEARIPLSEIYSPEVIANKPIQSNLSFSIRDYDGDRDKTFGYGGWFVLVDTKD